MSRNPVQPKTPNAVLPATAGAKEIVVYESGAGVRLEVLSDGETVWITQEQMCRLFGRTQPVIARHVANAFREGEVDEANNMQILHNNRRGQPLRIYDLDVAISVGYRVKSPQGVLFRRWATRVLREMLLNKLDEIKRIGALERRMDATDVDIGQLKQGMSYLVQQLSAPPPDPPRRKIGFAQDRR